jgi:hypothetical protein
MAPLAECLCLHSLRVTLFVHHCMRHKGHNMLVMHPVPSTRSRHTTHAHRAMLQGA